MGENFGVVMRVFVAAVLVAGLAAFGYAIYNKMSEAGQGAMEPEDVQQGQGDGLPTYNVQ